jgi:TPR repeat protein
LALLPLVGGCAALRAAQQEADAFAAQERACDGGDPRACFGCAEAYTADYHRQKREGTERPELLARARNDYRRACDRGIADACLVMARLEYSASDPRAIVDARKACDLGLAPGCLEAVDRVRFSGRPPEDQRRELVPLARRACELDVDACPEAASALMSVDPETAETLALRPCDARQLRACGRAAALRLDGAFNRRVQTRACEAGLADVCEQLAKVAVETKAEEARQLYRRACALGDESACGALGRFLVDPRRAAPAR